MSNGSEHIPEQTTDYRELGAALIAPFIPQPVVKAQRAEATTDAELTKLRLLTRDRDELNHYLSALNDFAMIGARPEQLKTMAHLLARGGLDLPKENPNDRD